MLPNQCCQWILFFSVSVTTPHRVPPASPLLVQKWAAPKGLRSYPEDWQAGIPLPGNPRRHQSRCRPVLDIRHQLCWLCLLLSQAGSQRWVLLFILGCSRGSYHFVQLFFTKETSQGSSDEVGKSVGKRWCDLLLVHLQIYCLRRWWCHFSVVWLWPHKQVFYSCPSLLTLKVHFIKTKGLLQITPIFLCNISTGVTSGAFFCNS